MGFFCIMHQFGDGKFYRSGFPRFPHGRLKSLSDTEVLSGFMMSFRKSVLDEFKFDATLSGHSYMEDVDMAYRVSRKHRLFFNPDAELEHRHVRRPVDNSRDRRRQFLYNHRYFYEKNFSQQPSWHRLWHWWSIIGMFIWCITKPPTWFIGYCQALVRFRKDRKQLLGELRAIGENRG